MAEAVRRDLVAGFDLLTGLDLDQVPADAEANLLSQYRFLRAIELGFGVFTLMNRHEIFENVGYNALFLSIMAAGVAARLLSLALDGNGRRRCSSSSSLSWAA
jgi:hypothetical protein